eukprot:scaffold184_cov316-Pinguiococcus_pyrenoidosus.AAC.2
MGRRRLWQLRYLDQGCSTSSTCPLGRAFAAEDLQVLEDIRSRELSVLTAAVQQELVQMAPDAVESGVTAKPGLPIEMCGKKKNRKKTRETTLRVERKRD